MCCACHAQLWTPRACASDWCSEAGNSPQSSMRRARLWMQQTPGAACVECQRLPASPNCAPTGETRLHVCPGKAAWLMQGPQQGRHAYTNKQVNGVNAMDHIIASATRQWITDTRLWLDACIRLSRWSASLCSRPTDATDGSPWCICMCPCRAQSVCIRMTLVAKQLRPTALDRQ